MAEDVDPAEAFEAHQLTLPRRVLVIDDDAIIRRFLHDGLSQYDGYEVIVAGDGEEGLRLLESFVPTCVVADIYMPRVDGRKLTRALKGDSRTAATPVIFMSARNDPNTRATALLSGGDDFLRKPFSIDDVYASIEAALAISPERRAQRQLEMINQLTANQVQG